MTYTIIVESEALKDLQNISDYITRKKTKQTLSIFCQKDSTTP